MRLSDRCGLPLAALWQQKGRTILTTLGVVFGSFVLTASLSTNQGVQEAIGRELGGSDALRQIDVQRESWGPDPDAPVGKVEVKGTMSDARRERLQLAISQHVGELSSRKPRKVLNQEKLGAIGALEHVEKVEPGAALSGFAIADSKAVSANMSGVLPDSVHHRRRLVAGRFFDSASERAAVVSEYLAYSWGFVDEADMKRVVGKTLRFEIRNPGRKPGLMLYIARPNGPEPSHEEIAVLDKVKGRLPAIIEKLGLSAHDLAILRKGLEGGASTGDNPVYAEEFPIVGVLRQSTREDQKELWDPRRWDPDILLPSQTATTMYFHVPGQAAEGIYALVVVDHESNVEGVDKRIRAMGLETFSFRENIKRERLMNLLIFGSMTCVAAVALFVAALGIANTMLMSVLERTREIGIMKAVGAGNGELRSIFLIEGALIGLVGGGMGLLLAWGASFPGDAWVRSLVSRNIKIELKESIFVFPFWLSATVMVFAVLVTTLAAVYPAHRAAKIDPVAAIRHE